MEWSDQQQRLVADAVRARREDVLGISQDEAIERSGGGVSKPVWSIMENARQSSFKRRTKAAVCRALGWTADSLDLIAKGGAPVVNGSAPVTGPDVVVPTRTASTDDRLDALEKQVQRLARGLILMEASTHRDAASEPELTEQLRELLPLLRDVAGVPRVRQATGPSV